MEPQERAFKGAGGISAGLAQQSLHEKMGGKWLVHFKEANLIFLLYFFVLVSL